MMRGKEEKDMDGFGTECDIIVFSATDVTMQILLDFEGLQED